MMLKGNLRLVLGPGDGYLMRNVPIEARFVQYQGEDDLEQVYQVIHFEGPDGFCNSRFAVPEGTTLQEAIAALADAYPGQQ